MADAPPVELRAGGRRFSAWTEVSATLSLEAAVGEFSFTVSERHPDDVAAREIRKGDAAEIAIHGETVITGWVDTRSAAYDAKSHTLVFGGRDRPADLVDCSAVHVPGEWHGLDALRIARILAAPFNVGVEAEVPVGAPFTRWRVQESETAFASIERMARHRGLLVTTDGLGSLVFTRSSAARRVNAGLALGRNILAGSATDSDRERFSVYRVKGQRVGSDFDWGVPVAAGSGTATDPGVSRYRPKTILAEAQGDPSTFQTRARVEANRRSAKARTVGYTVKGWRDDAGAVWRPNSLVYVRDEFLEVDRELLVAGVHYIDDAQGIRTELSLAPPDAFDVQALPEATAENLWTVSD